ncbi:MAG: substrate-binding domain-containing protein [Spirochaetia bacterium]|nr:substrate-binding domain-containing protein [Spirochaetia bacterium]
MPKSSLTAYRRIYESLKKRAKPGEERTVSETGLMEEFEVSRDTARKALNLLSRDGYARRIQGRGTVLAIPAQSAAFHIQIPVNELFFRSSPREPLRQKFFELMEGIRGVGGGADIRASIPLLRAGDPAGKQAAELMRPGSGIVFVSHAGMEDLIAVLRRERFPHVVHAPDGLELNRVSSDSLDGTRRAIETLVERGRKRILLVAPSRVSAWHEPMIRAWKNVLDPKGLPSDDSLFLELGEAGPEAGEQLEQELSRRQYDAIFCAGAERSLWVLSLLRKRGRIPGRDLSFISHEDHPEFVRQEPSVSAVRVPLQLIGERLGEALVPMIRFGYRDDIRITLDEELVLRGSV